MNNLKIFGKFLDQPILITKLNKSMPKIMACGAGIILANDAIDVFKKNDEDENFKKDLFKKAIILTFAISSALLAPKIASKITKRTPIETLDEIRNKNEKLINDFLKNNNLEESAKNLLNKAKNEILTLSEIKKLVKNLSNNNDGEKLFNELIPDPENIQAKDIFSEIGYLSIYGLVPVIGGIIGGIFADKAVKESNKEKITDKINEGIYQYLANIFMCNIGAGISLSILEGLKITSKTARAIGMTTGIILTGVIGGSKIANFISKKIVQPMICPNREQKERKPELVDIGLHTDDIATVSLLSGLKWIEPVLPVLYSVSGYKAGIGYRN